MLSHGKMPISDDRKQIARHSTVTARVRHTCRGRSSIRRLFPVRRPETLHLQNPFYPVTIERSNTTLTVCLSARDSTWQPDPVRGRRGSALGYYILRLVSRRWGGITRQALSAIVCALLQPGVFRGSGCAYECNGLMWAALKDLGSGRE